MSRENPFPGMNPWMQNVWPDVHTRLIGYIADAIEDFLPDDLVVRTEEGVRLAEGSEIRADLAISETDSWKSGIAPGWSPESDVPLAQPVIVKSDSGPTPRWIEIKATNGDLVTVIEVTSPANKTRSGREDFEKKFSQLWQQDVSTVEIDLVTGVHSARSVRTGFQWPKEPLQIVVNRPPDFSIHEVYPCPIRERLPAFRIPLRSTEQDLPLDLQPLINQCYKKGRYWTLPYQDVPDCSMGAADLKWAKDIVKVAGFC